MRWEPPEPTPTRGQADAIAAVVRRRARAMRPVFDAAPVEWRRESLRSVRDARTRAIGARAEFAAAIRDAVALGVPLGDIARVAGVHKSYVSRVARGERLGPVTRSSLARPSSSPASTDGDGRDGDGRVPSSPAIADGGPPA